MSWIALAFLAPIFSAVSNVIDSHLSNKIFNRIGSLVVFSVFANIVFLPIVMAISWPGYPPLHLIPWFIVAGVCEVVYLYPYFHALRKCDTSIVVSLYSLGKIFIPILAYYSIGEELAHSQYLGFLIVIASGAFLSIEKTDKVRMNSAFFDMLLVSIVLAVQTVSYKYIFEHVDWGTGYVWPTIFAGLTALCLLLHKQIRKDFKTSLKKTRKIAVPFVASEIFAFLGAAAMSMALIAGPVTIVSGINSLRPFIILMFAILLHRLHPKTFKERIERKHAFKKAMLFLLMLGGIFLIVH